MKRRDVRRVTAALAGIALAAGGLGHSGKAFAETEVTERPIEEFVAAQGTFDLGILFVPPVPNFLGTDEGAVGSPLEPPSRRGGCGSVKRTPVG